jgi:hypothetical protein
VDGLAPEGVLDPEWSLSFLYRPVHNSAGILSGPGYCRGSLAMLPWFEAAAADGTTPFQEAKIP